MRKGRDVTGLPVLTYDTGEKVGQVRDLLFDPENNKVLGVLIGEGGWLKEPRVIPFSAIKSIGSDGLIIQSGSLIVTTKDNEELSKAVETSRIAAGARVFTESGRDLGKIDDIVFDEVTGQVVGYDVSGGFFADRFRGKAFLPAPETTKVGKHVVYVPDSSAERMEEQGGVAGAVRETGASARERATGMVGRVRERGEELGGRFATMTKDQQKRFVLGKTSPVDLLGDSGQPIVAAGQTITEEEVDKADREGKLGELTGAVSRGQMAAVGGSLREQMSSLYETVSSRLGEATSQFQERQLESVKGRTASRDVTADDGTVIIAQGQPVTQEVIDAARRLNKVSALLTAVGLGRIQEMVETARSKATEIFRETSREVEKEETHGTAQAPREETEAERVYAPPTEQALLGKTVDHTIVDAQGNVILEAGQTVTPEAFERAREAGKLEELQAAVYTVAPKEGEGTYLR